MRSETKEIKVEVYQKIQKNLASMGFTPNQQRCNNLKWNSVQIINVAVYSMNIILFGLYVIFEAKGIEDYMVSIFALTVATGIMICYISIIFKSDKLFTTIELLGKELTDST